MLFEFELTGAMALIMHADSIEGADDVAVWINDPSNKGKSKAGDDRTPPWKWQTALYHDGEQVVIPNDNLMAAFKYGASQVRIVPSKPGSYEKLSQSSLLVPHETIPLLVGGRPVPLKPILKLRDLPFAEQVAKVRSMGIELYTKRVVVKNNRNIRVRPRFVEWKARGTIQILDPEAISPDALKRILEAAGRLAGLGDRRPGVKWPKSPGPFGTFDVKIKAA